MLTDDFLWKGKLEGEKDSKVFTFFPTSRWKKSDRIIRQLLLSTVYISVIYQVFVVFFFPLKYKLCEDKDVVIFV